MTINKLGPSHIISRPSLQSIILSMEAGCVNGMVVFFEGPVVQQGIIHIRRLFRTNDGRYLKSP